MQESSVAFNLAELMRLEEQRSRVERGERERAQAEALRRQQEGVRAAQERRLRELQAAELAQLQAAAAREAALLRVRLDAESAERAGRERDARHHALELQRLRAPERQARLLRGACAVLLLLLLGSGALYVGALRPALASARQLALGATALAAQRALELQALRERLASAPAPAVAPAVALAPAPTPAPRHHLAPHAPRPTNAGRSHAPRVPRVRSDAPAADGLEDLDLASDDPLKGLVTAEGATGRRASAPTRPY